MSDSPPPSAPATVPDTPAAVPSPRTNADRLRAMSDAELFEFLGNPPDIGELSWDKWLASPAS